MYLCIDVGNTRVTFALIRNDEIIAHWGLSSRGFRTEDELAVMIQGCFSLRGIAPAEVSHVVIGSVVDHLTPQYEGAWRLMTGRRPMVVTGRTPMPVANGYADPDQVGVDRLANAVGGVARFGAPLIVVDFGTAVTFDVISADQVYLGGVIVPGPQMMIEALSAGAAKLPRIALERGPDRTIGRNTRDSIASGARQGLACLVDGLIERLRDELAAPECRAVATGGDGALYVDLCRRMERCEPFLTLLGLRDIHQFQSRGG